jgi:hypothetical protein
VGLFIFYSSVNFLGGEPSVRELAALMEESEGGPSAQVELCFRSCLDIDWTFFHGGPFRLRRHEFFSINHRLCFAGIRECGSELDARLCGNRSK